MATSSGEKMTPHQLIRSDYIQEALKVDLGTTVKLISFQIKDFLEAGENFSSMVTSVKVVYSSNGQEGETSYIAKVNPCKSENFNILVNVLFWKETQFYSKLLPLLNAELARVGETPLRVPSCLYFVASKGEEVMFFKDLRLEQFKMLDRKKSLDFAHTQMIVSELSRMHAASFLLFQRRGLSAKDILNEFPFLANWSDAVEEKGGNPVFNSLISDFLETAASIVDRCKGYEKVAESLRNLKANGRPHFEEQLKTTDQFCVLAHGDCWANNCLFRYSSDGTPEDCQILDWQISTIGSQVLDLHFLLYSSLDGITRNSNKKQLFSEYYGKFSSILMANKITPKFSLEQMQKEFEAKSFYGLVIGSVILPTVLGKSENNVDLDSLSGEDRKKKYKEYQEKLISSIEKNSLFEPRFISIIEDMVEVGVLEK